MHRITRQEILKHKFDQMISEEHRKEYLANRDAYKNSPEGLAEASKRQEAQQKYVASEKARMEEVKGLVNLKNYLYAHIVTELEALKDKNNQEILDEQQIQKVMAKYKPNLDYLKEKCLEFEKSYNGKKDYVYVTLYNQLINFDPIFIKYCPIEVLYQASIGWNLPANFMNNNKEYFMEKGYFKDPAFFKINAKHFTGISCIETMTDFDQIKKELKVNPSLFSQLQPVIRYNIINSNVSLKNLLHIAPTVLAYMTTEELFNVSDKCSSLVGNIIIKYPDLLQYFPTDYFRYFKPKAMFARATRANIHSALNQYYETMPELKQYMINYIAEYTAPAPNIEI